MMTDMATGSPVAPATAKQIAVRPDVSAGLAVKTLIHELAHALHGDEVFRTRREIQEVEVESVAYIVCDAIGLDTSDYSFSYVARWHRATWRRSKRQVRVLWSAQG